MRRALRALGAALIWVCCVAGVATAASFAINSAGRQVSLPVVDSGGVPVPPATSGTSTPTPTGTGQGTGPGTAVASSTQAPDPTPTSGGGSTSPRRTSSPSSTSAPAPSPTSASPSSPQPNPISDVVQTAGGTVELECIGTRATDYFSAQSADGWSGSVQRDSSSLITAVFKRHSTTITVRASCSSGRPKFSVSTHSDD